MKILIVGLGSMGKRRIRCLQTLGISEIYGFDVRSNRRAEAVSRYSIHIFDRLPDLREFDAVCISTPPDRHLEFILKAIEAGRPCFVEASVILEGLEDASNLAKKAGVLAAPSCTMRFHPAIKDINEIVQSNRYGKITNFSYHCGQFLPDWHPWEKVSEYYVSKKETGGAREIVPFELTWILSITGNPERIASFFGRTAAPIGADIDDSYSFALNFGSYFGSVTIDVVSRFATRSLILNLERAQIRWNWEDSLVRLFEADTSRWINYTQPLSQSAEGYNKNIGEQMYIDELHTFLKAVQGEVTFPNTLDDDIRVLKVVKDLEQSGHRQGEPVQI